MAKRSLATNTDPTTLPNAPIEQHYSVDETAGLLGLHEVTVRRAIYKNELRAFRVGSRLLIASSAIREFLATRAT